MQLIDKGPELTARHLTDWCAAKGIELRHIQPGKPNQNAFIERFNRSYGTEVLNGRLFASLDEVREILHQWIATSNEEHPCNALDKVICLQGVPRGAVALAGQHSG